MALYFPLTTLQYFKDIPVCIVQFGTLSETGERKGWLRWDFFFMKLIFAFYHILVKNCYGEHSFIHSPSVE